MVLKSLLRGRIGLSSLTMIAFPHLLAILNRSDVGIVPIPSLFSSPSLNLMSEVYAKLRRWS